MAARDGRPEDMYREHLSGMVLRPVKLFHAMGDGDKSWKQISDWCVLVVLVKYLYFADVTQSKHQTSFPL